MIDISLMDHINSRPREYGWRANNHSEYWGRKKRDGFLYRTGTLNPEALVGSFGTLYSRCRVPRNHLGALDLTRITSEFDARPECPSGRSGVSDGRGPRLVLGVVGLRRSAGVATRTVVNVLVLHLADLRSDQCVPVNGNPVIPCTQVLGYCDSVLARDRPSGLAGVRDVVNCGFVRRTVYSRLSIESFGNETVRLSPQHLLSCSRRGQRGCEGGHVDRAWQYLRKVGVVNEECYHYESGTTGKVPSCRIPVRANLFSLRCASKEVSKGGKRIHILAIISHNRRSSPPAAIMKVYKDLFMYGGGVYRHTGSTEEEYAMHSVRIVGWGHDSSLGGRPTKYWLVANSWGTGWGERGFLRIRRGTNESEIESFVLTVRARLAAYDRKARRRRPGRHAHPQHHHHAHLTTRSTRGRSGWLI
nr:tubulointerstitial nephritis antigen-like [Penaeus vannamei]